jgi:NAD(P)-dependent dehydrogenase (short-subunit alcohol dehydrogenase family)
MKLKNKVALITGGSSGIGFATALLFVKEGAKVAIVGRNREKGEDAVKKINGEAIYIQGDVSKESDAKKMVSLTVKKYGKLDILFNNAGIVKVGSVTEMEEKDWDEIVDINLKGVFLVTKFAIPEMLKNGGGSIINTSSIYGLTGTPYYSAYCATKGAIVTFTKSVALEYATKNIRVNCICPANVSTEMVEKEIELWGEGDPHKMEEQRVKMAQLQPIGRMATPEEIAKLVLFLASDDSSYITGAAIPIDGGFTAQ